MRVSDRIALIIAVFLAAVITICGVVYVVHFVEPSYQNTIQAFNESVSMDSMTNEGVGAFKSAAMRVQALMYVLAWSCVAVLPFAVVVFLYRPIRKAVNKYWRKFK